MISSPSTWDYSESLGSLRTWSNWMAWLPAGMPGILAGRAQSINPENQLSFAKISSAFSIPALLERIPVGFAHREKAGNSQVLAIAACKAEALSAQK